MREIVVATFYRRLFELEPGLRHLFDGDMKRDGRALIAALGAAVEKLEHPETVVRNIRALDDSHILRRIPGRHQKIFNAALLWTLEDRLGNLFTEEVRDAWHAAGDVVGKAIMAAGGAHSMDIKA